MNPAENTQLDQQRLTQLRNAAGNGPVLILTHDNPDPDALASGKALALLLKAAWNISCRLFFSGIVQRPENRELLALLTPEWIHCDQLPPLDDFSAVALVDTQPGAGNNRLPSNQIPKIVFDHHNPMRVTISKVAHADVRPEIGATATLLHLYLEAARIVPDTDLATAMFYGLKTDTRGLSRGASSADEAAYLRLLARTDHAKLAKIEQAGLPQAYFRALSRGLHAAQVFDRSVVADLGPMHRPDLAAELADVLIRLEQAKAVLCLGVHLDTLHFSVRTEPMGQDAGMLVQKVIVPPGRAGGHGTMAGGQVALVGQETVPLAEEIVRRFLKVMGETAQGEGLL